jgi:hypothetical protein
MTVVRKDDPIDLTKGEITYSSDYAKTLERRLSLAFSQSAAITSNLETEIINVEEYFQKNKGKDKTNKTNKRHSLRNKEGKFVK